MIDWDEAAQRHVGALADNDRDDWPVHQPIAPEAPIPGRYWYGVCDPDRPCAAAAGGRA